MRLETAICIVALVLTLWAIVHSAIELIRDTKEDMRR